MLSVPTGTVPAPQPASRQQGQKTAPVAGKLAAATHTIDAASAKRGVPGSTSWKQDRNAPRNKLQPLSLPLQALSRKKLIRLLREISWIYLVPLRSPSPWLPPQTGEARQHGREFIGCFPRLLLPWAAEGTLCNPPWFPMPPHSRKAAWGGRGRGQVGCIPLCWVLPAGRRNCPREAHWEEGDGGGCAPHIETCCCFEHPNPFCCAASCSKACPGHCDTLGISSVPC